MRWVLCYFYFKDGETKAHKEIIKFAQGHNYFFKLSRLSICIYKQTP